MSKPQLKNSLLVKKLFADMIADIVSETREQFKNLDIDDLKKDLDLIKHIMENIDFKSAELKSKVRAQLDKNAVLLVIVKQLFPNINDAEVDAIQYVVRFILENKVIKKKGLINTGIKLLTYCTGLQHK
jgi:hypothetical protein